MNYDNKTAENFHNDFLKMMDASDEGAKVEFETEFRGKKTSMLANGFRLESGDWIRTVVDITDQKNREAELESLYKAIDVMSAGVIVWDKDHKLVFANRDRAKIPLDLNSKWEFLDMICWSINKSMAFLLYLKVNQYPVG